MQLNPIQLPSECARCAVRSRALCSVLSDAELAILSDLSRRRTFKAGQIVVMEGDQPIVANIASGVLAEKKAMPDGREQIVSILFPADFIGGDLSVPADTTVEAITDTRLCIHTIASFEALMREKPALRDAYLAHAQNELRNAREWMLLLGKKGAEERVATFLLRLATRQTQAGCSHFPLDEAVDGMAFDIALTRAQMAAFLGLTIETVSRRIRALQSAGLIELVGPRGVRLVDAGRLKDMATG